MFFIFFCFIVWFEIDVYMSCVVVVVLIYLFFDKVLKRIKNILIGW